MASKQLTNWNEFQSEIQTRSDDIAAMLPPHVSWERFYAVSVSAVKREPALLDCTPRSLFGEITKAASDGLLPDGREGVIQSYSTKVKYRKDGKDLERWEKTAVWMPMTHGMRKRANELESILVDAQVVYKGDEFLWIQGDHPEINHKPAQLGTPRGDGIGAYAIFKDKDRILHREVMDCEQIEKVRAKSKQPNGMLWKEFWEEAWRKTVIRRGFKTVPVGASLDQVVQREDEQYTFDALPNNGKALPPAVGKQRPPAEVVSGTAEELPPAVGDKVVFGATTHVEAFNAVQECTTLEDLDYWRTWNTEREGVSEDGKQHLKDVIATRAAELEAK